MDSDASPKLSLVVPLYNEAESVEALQDEIHEVLKGIEYELVLVDDGSTDETAELVKPHSRTRFIQLTKNTGQSAAMYAGIMRSRGEVIGLIDGDLQNDPADLPKLMDAVENGADLACGYRANRKDTAFKRFQSRIANAVRSRFTGDGVRDTGCSLKAMRRDCRDALTPFRGMHRFIPAFFHAAGYSIVELPVNHRERKHGESKYGGGLGRAIPATTDMFGVRWIMSRRIPFEAVEREWDVSSEKAETVET
ncbi:MAG: glycosyltransferase family 2 protein [Verrucomicrobiota bacterium]